MILVLLVLCVPRSLGAQGPQTLYVTTSGAASVGSYEGGYLYYLEETLERNPEVVRLRIATGTSFRVTGTTDAGASRSGRPTTMHNGTGASHRTIVRSCSPHCAPSSRTLPRKHPLHR